MRPVEPRFCATGREVGSSAILNTGWADGLAAPGDGQRRGAVHVACRQRERRTPGARRSGRSLGASASGRWAAFAPARRTGLPIGNRHHVRVVAAWAGRTRASGRLLHGF